MKLLITSLLVFGATAAVAGGLPTAPVTTLPIPLPKPVDPQDAKIRYLSWNDAFASCSYLSESSAAVGSAERAAVASASSAFFNALDVALAANPQVEAEDLTEEEMETLGVLELYKNLMAASDAGSDVSNGFIVDCMTAFGFNLPIPEDGTLLLQPPTTPPVTVLE